MAPNRTYPDDLRDRLVAAALDRLRDHHPEDMSLRDLAAECGTSTNAIYSIFGGKTPLVTEVAERAKSELVGTLMAHTGTTGLEGLAMSGAAYRAWARAQPALYRLVFSGEAGHGALRFGQEDEGDLRSFLAELMADGVLRPTDPVALSATLFSVLHGFVLLELDRWPDGDPEADALFNAMLGHLATGILSDASLAALGAA